MTLELQISQNSTDSQQTPDVGPELPQSTGYTQVTGMNNQKIRLILGTNATSDLVNYPSSSGLSAGLFRITPHGGPYQRAVSYDNGVIRAGYIHEFGLFPVRTSCQTLEIDFIQMVKLFVCVHSGQGKSIGELQHRKQSGWWVLVEKEQWR